MTTAVRISARLRRAGLVALVSMLALAGCSKQNRIEVSAHFSDVGDLAPQAPVMLADITVGNVKDISLDGNRALVTMDLDTSAHVPKDVTARVRRTSLLGERIVDLVVPDGEKKSSPLLKDGDEIRNTDVRPDLEDLVREGTDVLTPIAASEVATLVNEGAKGFGGQGDDLRNLLQNFQVIVHGLATHTGDIRALVDSLNQLNTTLASHADAQAKSLQNTARSLEMLRQESDELQSAVHELNRLAIGARGILSAHSDEMTRFFSQMRVILGVLQEEEGAITGLLKWAPNHNRNTQLVEFQAFNQIFQDFVICGLNDDPSDPARTCKDTGQSQGPPQP